MELKPSSMVMYMKENIKMDNLMAEGNIYGDVV
jgi:hypothetical protein